MKKYIKVLPDALVVAGVIAISLGAGLVYMPAGFVVGGFLMIGLGIVSGRKIQQKAPE